MIRDIRRNALQKRRRTGAARHQTSPCSSRLTICSRRRARYRPAAAARRANPDAHAHRGTAAGRSGRFPWPGRTARPAPWAQGSPAAPPRHAARPVRRHLRPASESRARAQRAAPALRHRMAQRWQAVRAAALAISLPVLVPKAVQSPVASPAAASSARAAAPRAARVPQAASPRRIRPLADAAAAPDLHWRPATATTPPTHAQRKPHLRPTRRSCANVARTARIAARPSQKKASRQLERTLASKRPSCR